MAASTGGRVSIAFMRERIGEGPMIITVITVGRTEHPLGTSNMLRNFLRHVEEMPGIYDGERALHDAGSLAAAFIAWYWSLAVGPAVIEPASVYYGWAVWTSPGDDPRYWPEASWEY